MTEPMTTTPTEGAVRHGFILLREQEIPELKTHARLYRHQKTGAELLSLVADDENKCFGVSFRTPPDDSTGVAHILEHAVLCGSRRYPLKDPFVALIKGSLNTFLNAFTFPDKTCYPVASQNLQDFYNLVDVYLDTVFYPLLDRYTFQQQAWHYDVDAPDAPLVYRGVVFNEMKGARSSPEGLLYDVAKRSLFPDTTYGHDSGGNPKHIPDLTYEQLTAFHARFYHPSNARLFFYGDDDPDERLRRMDAWLSPFEARAVDSRVGLQPRFSAPKRVTHPYAAGDERAGGNKALVTVNWLLPDAVTQDAETTLAIHILNHLLIGTPASPLRRALIESGLGDDLAGDGFEDELRQGYFSTGLKGVAAEDVDRVEALVLETLQRLAEEGFDEETREASLNTVEFRLRENNTGSFPRGLSLMLRALTTWLHDGDPLAPLAFEAPLASVKARALREPLFEDLLRRCLVDNPHRTTVVLEPDPDVPRRTAEAEAARLAEARAAMTDAELQTVIEDNRRLRERQETPDPPEAVATLPSLRLSDLDRASKTIPIAVWDHDGARILSHDLFTNGILYLDLGLDLHALPQELLPYAALFGRALLQMGTEQEDYARLTRRINRRTGGIRHQTYTTVVRGAETAAARLFLRAKATPEQADDVLAILRDVLLTVRLDDRERFAQMVGEEKARLESRLIPGGTGFVDGRLRAHFHEAGWASEQMGGIDYLFFVRALDEAVANDWPRVLADLERVRALLVNRNGLLFNLTMDAANADRFAPKLTDFLRALPAAPVLQARWDREPGPEREGLTIPAQVNYVAKAGDLYDGGLAEHGSSLVVAKHLRTTWLWEKVRVQGGAYGGSCSWDPLSGVFVFTSYRDPNVLATLAVYDGAAAFLRDTPLDEAAITGPIIGTIGDVDMYQLPDAKGFTSMARHLAGETDDLRQRRRDEILSTSRADFARFADALDGVRERGHISVLGSEAALETANAESPEAPLPLKKVL